MVRILLLGSLVAVSGFVQTCNPDVAAEAEVYEEVTDLKNTMEATDSQGNVYTVGTDQVSENDQDAYVEKRAPNGKILWSMHHSATSVDERAVLIHIDRYDIPWVVFTVDGGSTEQSFITQKYLRDENVWGRSLFRGYGRADGAAKVAVVACINPQHGKLERATFLMSRTNEGNIDAVEKTNTLVVDSFFVGDTVAVDTRSWYLPPGVGANHENFIFHPDATDSTKVGDSWPVRYIFSRGLDLMYSADIIE